MEKDRGEDWSKGEENKVKKKMSVETSTPHSIGSDNS